MKMQGRWTATMAAGMAAVVLTVAARAATDVTISLVTPGADGKPVSLQDMQKLRRSPFGGWDVAAWLGVGYEARLLNGVERTDLEGAGVARPIAALLV